LFAGLHGYKRNAKLDLPGSGGFCRDIDRGEAVVWPAWPIQALPLQRPEGTAWGGRKCISRGYPPDKSTHILVPDFYPQELAPFWKKLMGSL
jgi:hypothetical protein